MTGPLPAAIRAKVERTGLCMGCHQNMADTTLWAQVNSPKFVSNEQHRAVMDRALRAYARERSQ